MTGASAGPASGSQEEGPNTQATTSSATPASSSSSSHTPGRTTSSALTHPPARDRVSGGSKKKMAGGSVRGEERMGMLGVRVGEKRGVLYNAIPCMPLPVAVLCCLLNIVIPGMDKMFD